MNLRNRFIATVGATALLATTVLTGVAQSANDTASVVINAQGTPTFSVAITASDFAPLTYNFIDQSTSGTVKVTTSDTRGTAAGWNVQLNASNFDGAGTTDEIAVDPNLAFTSGSITQTAGTSGIAGQARTLLAPVTTADQTLWVAGAGSGDGIYDLDLAASLNVPGGTLVDTYTSTLTVTLASGPGN
jgi:hypothetical protein